MLTSSEGVTNPGAPRGHKRLLLAGEGTQTGFSGQGQAAAGAPDFGMGRAGSSPEGTRSEWRRGGLPREQPEVEGGDNSDESRIANLSSTFIVTNVSSFAKDPVQTCSLPQLCFETRGPRA